LLDALFSCLLYFSFCCFRKQNPAQLNARILSYAEYYTQNAMHLYCFGTSGCGFGPKRPHLPVRARRKFLMPLDCAWASGLNRMGHAGLRHCFRFGQNAREMLLVNAHLQSFWQKSLVSKMTTIVLKQDR
jgi:hypothetical protein